MRKFIILLILILPFTLNSSEGYVDKVEESLQSLGYQKIDMFENMNFNYEITAKLNGKHNIQLQVNFERSASIFNSNLLKLLDYDLLKLKSKNVDMSEFGETYIATIDSLTFDQIHIPEFDVLAVDFSSIPALENLVIEGIIGRDFLIKYKAIVDYENNKLYLKIN